MQSQNFPGQAGLPVLVQYHIFYLIVFSVQLSIFLHIEICFFHTTTCVLTPEYYINRVCLARNCILWPYFPILHIHYTIYIILSITFFIPRMHFFFFNRYTHNNVYKHTHVCRTYDSQIITVIYKCILHFTPKKKLQG